MSRSLYKRLLGDDFESLGGALKGFHSTPSERSGVLDVQWSSRSLDRLICRLMRLPRPGIAKKLQLRIVEQADAERWIRSFNSDVIVTRQWLENGHLIESAGPIRFYFNVTVGDGGMVFEQLRATCFRVPMHRSISPTIHAVVHGDDEGWDVEVIIRIGPRREICRYAGRIQAKCK